jgi:hypothetical protein
MTSPGASRLGGADAAGLIYLWQPGA